MSGSVLRPGYPGAVAPAAPQLAAQPDVNALMVHHPLLGSRGPLPPRDPTRTGASPPVSQVAHSPMPPRMLSQPHGAPLPAPGGLPGLVVRVGPAGADAAQAHLRAGHPPDALIEAAANSLAMAAMVNGHLDPARYHAWVSGRLQFLAHISSAAELFGSVEAAERTIQAVMVRSGAAGGQSQQPGGQVAVRRSGMLPVTSPAVPSNALLNSRERQP